MTKLQLRYFLLRYRSEIIAGFLALVSYVAAFIFVSQPKRLLGISIAITVIGTLTTIYLARRSRPFYFAPLSKLREVNDWFGRGTFQLDRVNKSYKITNSEVGFCFAPALAWDNYVFEFEFRIIKQCLGILLRASNLSNCVMIQITQTNIRPHMRINGGWWVDEDSAKDLSFADTPIDSKSWYRGRITCDHATIDLNICKISSDVPVFASQWNIPPGPLNVAFGQDEKTQVTMQLPINLEFGTAGFRNFDAESALVRNVLLRRL